MNISVHAEILETYVKLHRQSELLEGQEGLNVYVHHSNQNVLG